MLEADPAAAGRVVQRMMDEEAAPHLDDVLLRRTDWAADPAGMRRLADRLGAALGWNESRRLRESDRTAGAPDPVVTPALREGSA